MRTTLRVNGVEHAVEAPRRATLLAVLRDELGLTGTRYGCGSGQCGACYVMLDGRPVASCLTTLDQVADVEITTVEGLAGGNGLSAVQRAFVEEDAMQCGYCTSGMLVSASALLARDPHPSDAAIREALEPHLCRCGVYVRAIRATKRAAGAG